MRLDALSDCCRRVRASLASVLVVVMEWGFVEVAVVELEVGVVDEVVVVV